MDIRYVITAVVLIMQGSTELRDEGVFQDSVISIDCVGSGVTCTGADSFGTITVTGGGGGVSDGDKGDITVTGSGATWTIDPQAVTYSKIQNVATDRILGRYTVGSGTCEELTTSQVLDFISSTQGTVLYRNATNWVALSPGTSGDMLTTNGPGANPSWTTPPGGGGGGGLSHQQTMARLSIGGGY